MAITYPISDEILLTLSPKTRLIVQWLLTEAVQDTIDSRYCNWKLVINGTPGNDIRTVVEKHEQISEKN